MHPGVVAIAWALLVGPIAWLAQRYPSGVVPGAAFPIDQLIAIALGGGLELSALYFLWKRSTRASAWRGALWMLGLVVLCVLLLARLSKVHSAYAVYALLWRMLVMVVVAGYTCVAIMRTLVARHDA